MEIHQMVKDAIQKNKNRIELFQLAVMNSVASLVYSEYISNMQQKQAPTQRIMVPSIRTVQELLLPETKFGIMDSLSEHLIDRINHNPLFDKYRAAPELEMFLPDNIEIMKTIFDLYIIPNISRTVPGAIARKFRIGDPQNQQFFESNEIDLFNRAPMSCAQMDYIEEETILNILLTMPTMDRETRFPEKNRSFELWPNEILTISNLNAISPIHIDEKIIKNRNNIVPDIKGRNDKIIDMLSFVTDTKITGPDDVLVKVGNKISYDISTGAFNQVSITRLKGIDCTEDNENGEKA